MKEYHLQIKEYASFLKGDSMAYEQFFVASLAAEGYLKTACLAWKAYNNALDLPKISFPYIINMSLAIELYIKALLCKDDIEYNKTHDLLSLYNLLTNNYKNEISKYYSSEIKLETFFQQHKTIFIKYRYPQEFMPVNPINLKSLESLAEALNKICVNIINNEDNNNEND